MNHWRKEKCRPHRPPVLRRSCKAKTQLPRAGWPCRTLWHKRLRQFICQRERGAREGARAERCVRSRRCENPRSGAPERQQVLDPGMESRLVFGARGGHRGHGPVRLAAPLSFLRTMTALPRNADHFLLELGLVVL